MQKITKRDLFIALGLFVAGFFYCFLGTFSLDFIRDTEADRTLISIEMHQRGSYSVPYLLGQEFLTKPPGYYWSQAATFALTGSYDIVSARLSTVISLAILLFAHFLFLRRLGWSRGNALFSTGILASFAAIFRIYVLAEIDGLFTTLTALAMYLGCLSVLEENKYLPAIASWFFAALAFLVKGPPVLLFSTGGLILFALVALKGTAKKWKLFKPLFLAHGAGILLCVLIVGLWANLVIAELGKEKVMDHLNYQVVQRVTGEAKAHAGRNRGPLFYVKATLAGTIPWTPLLFVFFFPLFDRVGRRRFREDARITCDWDYPNRCPYHLAILFAICTAIPSYIGLVATAGKASRYMLPLFPVLAIICAHVARVMAETTAEKHLLRFCIGLGLILGIGGLAAIPKAITITADTHKGILGALGLALPALFLAFTAWKCTKKNRWRVGLALVVLIVFARAPYNLIFATKRNLDKSPRPVAAAIDILVPKGEPIYILAMYERWICYYLITEFNRPVLRLRKDHGEAWAKGTQSQKAPNEPIARGNTRYLLINKVSELPSLTKLRDANEQTKILGEYTQNKRSFYLVEAPVDAITANYQSKGFLGRK